MSAAAPSIAGAWRSSDARPLIRPAAAILALAIAFGCASGAHAQVAGSLAFETDYRLRGLTMSDGHPVATAQMAYDDPSGFFFGLNGGAILTGEGPRFLGVQANAGYARQVSPSVSLEAGLHHADYHPAYPSRMRRSYSEIYAGATLGQVTARLFYSPDYFYRGIETLYGEVEAYVRPAPNWTLSGHAGALDYVRTPKNNYPYPTRYDWQVRAARQLGDLEIHAALSSGGPGKDYYRGRPHDSTVVTAGASWSF